MTGIAQIACINMPSPLATGRNPVMTAGATTQHRSMINSICGDRCPGCRTLQVTGIALIVAVDMCATLARCRDAIVAGGTRTDDMHVINIASRYRCPTGRKFLVTGAAYSSAVDVRPALAACGYTVMTGFAIVHKTTVVNHRDRHPR